MLQKNDLHMTPAEALLALKNFDCEIAFRQVYAMFWKKMFAIAYSRLQDKQEAEDVTHDVFVSLWVNRKKLEINALENYLSVAVKNMVLTKLRKKNYEHNYILSLQGNTSTLPQVETALHSKHILEKVHAEIEQLPEKCKLIFKYSRHEGMPVKQIARHLSISPKTVENQLNKAMKQLRLAARTLLSSF